MQQHEPRPATENVSCVELVLGAGAEPFCDSADVARLRQPSRASEPEAVEEVPLQAWPVRSRQTEAWVATLHYRRTGRPIRRTDLMDALLILEGMAYENYQSTPVEEAVEQDPVLASIVLLLDGVTVWEGNATKLYAELTQLAAANGIMTGSPAWPTDAARLGYRLPRLSTVLTGIGVTYSFDRSSSLRKHILLKSRVADQPSNRSGGSNATDDDTSELSRHGPIQLASSASADDVTPTADDDAHDGNDA